MNIDNERRRYFRINETVGIAYEILDESQNEKLVRVDYAPGLLDLISQQDEQIEKLLLSLNATHPKVSELASLLNQKLERIAKYVSVGDELVTRIASKVREANLSACGIAFNNSEYLAENTRIKLELTLFPSNEVIVVSGLVVGSDQLTDDIEIYYCRVDFYAVSSATQERLIQYIVQSQGAQLKSLRNQVD